MRHMVSAIVLLLLVPVCFVRGEDSRARYEFDPPGEVRIYATGYGSSQRIWYSCPMLPGKHVVIPEGWDWGVYLYLSEAPHLSVLKKHLLARRASSLDIGYSLTTEDLDVLAAMPWLESISFDSVLVKGDWLKVLEGCNRLSFAHFRECQFEDDAVKALADMKVRMGISTHDCLFSDAQWMSLQGNRNISSIWQDDVPLGWVGFEVLPTLPGLESVWLSGTFSEQDALRLKPLDKLEWLDLDSPLFSDGCPELIESLRSLHSLHVTCCRSPERFLNACAELPELTYLDMKGARFDAPSIEVLKSMHALWLLSLEGCTGLTSAVLEDRRTLASLDADAGLIRQVGPEQARKMKALTTLTIIGDVGEAEASFIARLPNLQDVTFNGALTPEGARALSGAMPGLREFKAEGLFGDVQMLCLAGHKELKTLQLHDARGLSKDGLALIGRLTKLKKLEIWHASDDVIDDSFVDVLLRLPDLEDVYIGDAERLTMDGLKKLAAQPKLTSFSPAPGRLKEMRVERVRAELTELIVNIRSQFGLVSTKYPGSGVLTPDKWPSWPGASDTLFGYRFKYVSNAGSPTASDGTRFAFLAVPATLEYGTVAFVGPSPNVACYESEPLNFAAIARLTSAAQA
ncbi:MAG: hypothetical protein WC712_12440, partial [Candidatus Brocadiia bacterium]